MRRNIIDYFKKNLKKGYTPDSLKFALINQGYPRIEILLALDKANKELAQEAPILKEKPKITHQLLDEEDNPITIEKPLWKRLWNF